MIKILLVEEDSELMSECIASAQNVWIPLEIEMTRVHNLEETFALLASNDS